ncbi:MAG TPA: hypothetical protein VJU79_01140, partial [Candidatus Dormibacteraeota bacterium]|nr:hypothetical protein [Candidatus Dormibacteraeota bacterium]
MSDVAPRLRLRARSGRLAGSARLLLFAAVLGGAGATIWLLPLQGAHPLLAEPAVPWWAMLVACYVCRVLHVHTPAEQRSGIVSLTEVPVAIGLF